MRELKLLIENCDLEREKWLAVRRQYFTATDWPKLRGTSRFGGAQDVLLDKMGLAPELDQELLPLKVGKAMEPHILKALKPVLPAGELYTQAFFARGKCAMTPDLLIFTNPEGEPCLREFKVHVKEWRGNLPEEYRDQVEFQLAVLGYEMAKVVDLKVPSFEKAWEWLQDPNFELDPTWLDFHEVTISIEKREKILAEAEAWFEAHVEFGEPLPAAEKASKPTWEGMVLDPDLAEEFRAAKAATDLAKAKLEEITAKVEERLGNAQTLQGAGFAVERTFKAGAKSVAYAKVLDTLKPNLNEEQTAGLQKILEANTKFNKPSIGLTIKEA